MPTKRRVRSDMDERTKKGKLNMTSKVHLEGFFATPSAALPSLQAIMDDDEVPCGQPCKPQKELNIRGIELPPYSPGKDMTEDTVELPPVQPWGKQHRIHGDYNIGVGIVCALDWQ